MVTPALPALHYCNHTYAFCSALWCSHLCSLPCTVMLTPVLSALHCDAHICVPCTTLLWKEALSSSPTLLFCTTAESEHFLSCPEVLSTATVTCFSSQIPLYFKSQYPIVQRHFQFVSLKAGAKPLRNTPSRLWKQCMWTHRHISQTCREVYKFQGEKINPVIVNCHRGSTIRDVKIIKADKLWSRCKVTHSLKYFPRLQTPQRQVPHTCNCLTIKGHPLSKRPGIFWRNSMAPWSKF